MLLPYYYCAAILRAAAAERLLLVQADAMEVLVQLLDSMHESLNKGDSQIPSPTIGPAPAEGQQTQALVDRGQQVLQCCCYAR